MTKSNFLYYWGCIPLVLIAALAFNGAVDIALHDSYFVTTRFQLALFLSSFLFISGLGYFALRKKRINRWLTRLHNGLTFGGGFLFFLLSKIPVFPAVITWQTLGYLIPLGLIFLGFIIYLINLLIVIICR
jgi:heme/copper-type cytochrome/quinol oxidase subunit 1